MEAGETFVDLHFPKAGIDRAGPFGRQPARPSAGGAHARTAAYGLNVRAYDPRTNRARGGSRPGLQKYLPNPPVAGWLLQDLAYVSGTYPPPGGGTVQTTQSGRIVTLVAVSQGNVYAANVGDTAWITPTNNTGRNPPLIYTGLVRSTSHNQKMYFADGHNWAYYAPKSHTVENWTASAGTLPVDNEGNGPRLICTWRGRIVLSGHLRDSQNWFMSRVGDAHDWDYSPASTSPTQAVAGNNSPMGLIGDSITALIPYSDDVLIFGGDHTIYMMRGDPMHGGQIDLITDAIGMAWGIPWCKDPSGVVYFMSNRTGIFTLVPGQQPVRISQQITKLLDPINTGSHGVRLLWDDRLQGLHVFVTALAAPADTTHFFYEARAGAWWTDRFANTNHNPLACCTLDGNNPDDRVPLIGSWDGYVRSVDPDAADDDGTDIATEVWIGPLLTRDLDEVLLKDVQGVLGETSESVSFAVHVGASAEEALSASPAVTGTFSAGRNLTQAIRRAGHAVYLKLYSDSATWALEQIRARIAARGKIRRRGH